MEYLRQYRAVCAHPGPSSVGPSNTVYLQMQDSVRQAMIDRQHCPHSKEKCDQIMAERIYNSYPPPRA
jgi:hypothetical protein